MEICCHLQILTDFQLLLVILIPKRQTYMNELNRIVKQTYFTDGTGAATVGGSPGFRIAIRKYTYWY